MTTSKLIELGLCTKPHGIKGSFTFNLANPESRTLQKGMTVLLLPFSEASSLTGESAFEIESISYGPKVICTLKGVNDRNVVEAMIPFTFSVKREWLDDEGLEEGEFYLNDLLGLKVVAENDEAFKGVVKDFYENGAQTVLCIKKEGAFEMIELPFVDAFIKDVDLEAGVIVANIPQWIE